MSKNHIYSKEILEISKVGKAVAHGARIEILREIKDRNSTTNQFMSQKLGLSTATLHNHIEVLLEAELIEKEYFNKFGIIRRTEKHHELINPYIL